ncbi:unnamed protein product [Spirodela intermedia]|uniref:Uncharacterized protein n=1 Tax=Spirodela intermedia TaxID=51605 RepID=A0A7I8IYQ3_SPIIN|nr:unnamed protein product [Spirodela intermedia]CAA6662919.1 unnamed protein product [Spirodela intermedia]
MSMPLHLLAVHEWKLNVDGASQGNPGPSGGGGILHDSTGCILFAFSNFYNIRTNTEAEAMAQEYLGRHHAMSRTHHNHYASVPRRESDSQRPCYAWSQIASEDSLLFLFTRPTTVNQIFQLHELKSSFSPTADQQYYHIPSKKRGLSPSMSSSPLVRMRSHLYCNLVP